MSVYESIMAGLTEAVEDAKSSEKKLQRRIVTVIPVKEYQADEVKKTGNQPKCRKKPLLHIWGFLRKQ